MKIIKVKYLTYLICAIICCGCDGELKMPVYFNGKSSEDLFEDEQEATLADAAAKGKTEIINRLVKEGVNVNATGIKNLTPLMWSLCKRNIKGFKCLLENGADPDIQLDGDTSVVSWAAMASNPYYLKLALKHGGNPNLENPKNKRTPLFESVMYLDSIKHLEILLDAGADINHQDKCGETVLHVAAGQDHYNLIYYLIEKGADPTIKDIWGYTLVYSIEGQLIDPNSEQAKYRLKVVEQLLKRGMKVKP